MQTLWTNARIATLAAGTAGLGTIEGGAILADADGRIAWVGPMADSPVADGAVITYDLEGRWVTPGLIDCHTHLVHGGDRAREFEMRLEGAGYEEIARAGGGIVSTVKATRAGKRDGAGGERARPARPADRRRRDDGRDQVRLWPERGERGCHAARREEARRRSAGSPSSPPASPHTPCHRNTRTTAAAISISSSTRSCRRWRRKDWPMPSTASWKAIAFSGEEIARVFDKAKALGLQVKLHADQLSNLHGAALAASYGALSADHLEYTDEAGVQAMADAGSVAVLLPGAFYTLREKQLPPVAAFRRHGVAMAVATDANPGTSPITSLLTVMNMAATLFRLTVDEVLAGRDARGRPRARAARRNRHDRARQMVRSRHMGHRAAGRTRLPDRLQSALQARLEEPMTPALRLVPGQVPLSVWREIYFGADCAVDPGAKPQVEAAAETVRAIIAKGEPGLWNKHRLRQACERAHPGRGPRHAPAQHRALPCGRRRRAAGGPGRPPRHGAEGREPRAGLFRRALVDDRGAGGLSRRRAGAGHPGPGLGRGIGRPRAARAHDGRPDGRRGISRRRRARAGGRGAGRCGTGTARTRSEGRAGSSQRNPGLDRPRACRPFRGRARLPCRPRRRRAVDRCGARLRRALRRADQRRAPAAGTDRGGARPCGA